MKNTMQRYGLSGNKQAKLIKIYAL